ncbi:acyl carrier protein [Actinoplanes sp. TFC3]|uniref:acyl carrier protein n=1 Tax=Actinoplanes sp. TFC3 TaxID=1710355 RepID=UPI000835F701|nr:phosphopantetheine-binding protein [Actinoplanes sp. TFC3]
MAIEQVREIWKKQLALPQIADDDDFFDLGGHSLIMQKIQVDLRGAFGVEVPMDALFRRPTIAEISRHLDAVMATA